MAQQGLQMDFGEVDSSEIQLQRQVEYYQLISGTLANDLLLQEIKLPEFNAPWEYQQRYTIKPDFLPLSNAVFSGFPTGTFGAYSPFFVNGTILSEQAYQVNDKLVIGGFSYGANFIHGVASPNKSSYFDTYGSTMFMQYKVSKNIKIETSISVGQQHGPVPGF
jgi:hypothetical protein